MDKLKQRLIREARLKHTKIYPCAEKRDFSECYTRSDDRLFFWYNTHDRSTHVVSEKIAEMKPAFSRDFAPAA